MNLPTQPKFPAKRITVLLVEDHTIVREGFRRLLELQDDMEVVAEAEDGRKAITLARQLAPDIVLMDIAMPGLNGLETTRQLHKLLPAVKVIMLSAHSDDAYVKSAVELGAVGFLLKQTSSQQLCEAIREVYRGHRFFSPSLGQNLHRLASQSPRRRGSSDREAAHLTSREMEVLQLVAEGKANKNIGPLLGIGLKTVEKHREHLMAKLDIHDTAGLTRYAIAAGIIECSVLLTII